MSNSDENFGRRGKGAPRPGKNSGKSPTGRGHGRRRNAQSGAPATTEHVADAIAYATKAYSLGETAGDVRASCIAGLRHVRRAAKVSFTGTQAREVLDAITALAPGTAGYLGSDGLGAGCPCMSNSPAFGAKPFKLPKVSAYAFRGAMEELASADAEDSDVEVLRSAPLARRAAYVALLMTGVVIRVKQSPDGSIFRLTEKGRKAVANEAAKTALGEATLDSEHLDATTNPYFQFEGKTNDEGLTFREWINAANFARTNKWSPNKLTQRGWSRGEDPTEWAAFLDDKNAVKRVVDAFGYRPAREVWGPDTSNGEYRASDWHSFVNFTEGNWNPQRYSMPAKNAAAARRAYARISSFPNSKNVRRSQRPSRDAIIVSPEFGDEYADEDYLEKLFDDGQGSLDVFGKKNKPKALKPKETFALIGKNLKGKHYTQNGKLIVRLIAGSRKEAITKAKAAAKIGKVGITGKVSGAKLMGTFPAPPPAPFPVPLAIWSVALVLKAGGGGGGSSSDDGPAPKGPKGPKGGKLTPGSVPAPGEYAEGATEDQWDDAMKEAEGVHWSELGGFADPGIDAYVPLYVIGSNGQPADPVKFGTQAWSARANAVKRGRFDGFLINAKDQKFVVYKAAGARGVELAQPMLSQGELINRRGQYADARGLDESTLDAGKLYAKA